MDSKLVEKEIFLFEYISGGGYSCDDVPDSLLSEGFGMLSALILDFASLGFDIKLILDYRLNQEIIELKHKVERYLGRIHKKSVLISYELVEKLEHLDLKFEKFIKKTPFFMIIAPEFKDILYNYVKKAENIVSEREKGQILNPSSEFILIFSDKCLSEKYFSASIFQIPKTCSIEEFLEYSKKKGLKLAEERKNLHNLVTKNDESIENFILKPNDGVGCLNTFEISIHFKRFLDSNKDISKLNSELCKIVEYIKLNFPNEKYIVQKKIDGIPLSASIINNDGELDFFSINQQLIDFIPIQNMKHNEFIKCLKLDYVGGITPYRKLPSDIFEHLKKMSESLCRDFPFNGFFGIDFIINPLDRSIKIIEINPRVTTPYIAYSELFRKISPDENIASLFFSGSLTENEKKFDGISENCVYKKSKLTGKMDISYK